MLALRQNRAWIYLGSGLLIWFGLVALAAVVASLLSETDHPAILKAGVEAPDFTLASLAGEQVRLSDLRGKPVLVNFWATWCAPCVLEMPNIQKYYELYPQAFEVVAVNADEPLKVIEPFVKDMGLSFKILLDPGSTIQQLYQIHGYPTSYFLDAEGVIRAQHIGLLSEAQLADYLTQVGAIP